MLHDTKAKTFYIPTQTTSSFVPLTSIIKRTCIGRGGGIKPAFTPMKLHYKEWWVWWKTMNHKSMMHLYIKTECLCEFMLACVYVYV